MNGGSESVRDRLARPNAGLARFISSMTPSTPRLVSPCSEDLDAMKATDRGVFCDKCQHDVVDLRTTPRKKALAVLNELRRTSETGRVCARVMVRRDGTPVFAPDAPSAFARFAAPIALATSLAACAPSSRSAGTTPVAVVASTDNTNGTHQDPTTVVTTTTVTSVVSVQPAVWDEPVPAAGGLAWAPEPGGK
jgi:hypothetical protein